MKSAHYWLSVLCELLGVIGIVWGLVVNGLPIPPWLLMIVVGFGALQWRGLQLLRFVPSGRVFQRRDP